MIVRDLPDVAVIRAGVRHHHERWDGTGLPGRAGRRGDPARRPDPRGRRRLLRHDHDTAVPQGPRRARGAHPPRGRLRQPARRATSSRSSSAGIENGAERAPARKRRPAASALDAVPAMSPDRHRPRDGLALARSSGRRRHAPWPLWRSAIAGPVAAAQKLAGHADAGGLRGRRHGHDRRHGHQHRRRRRQ